MAYILVLLCLLCAPPVFAQIPAELLSAAKSGKAQAQHRVAYHYQNAVGVLTDHDRALHWYKLAAAQGLAKSNYSVAWTMVQDENPDYQMALSYLIKSEQLNNSGEHTQISTLNMLKRFCRKGLVDFPDNHTHAKDPKCWLARGRYLARWRDDQTVDIIRQKYSDVDQAEFAKARNYLKRALDAGEAEAAPLLARLMRNGQGGAVDEIAAQKLDRVSAKSTDPDVQYRLAQTAKRADDDAAYMDHLTRAAMGGHWSARRLSQLYGGTKYAERDEVLMLAWQIYGGNGRLLPHYGPGKDRGALPFENRDALKMLKRDDFNNTFEAAQKRAADWATAQGRDLEHAQQMQDSIAVIADTRDWVRETGGGWWRSQRYGFLAFWMMVCVIFGGFVFDRSKA